MNLNFTDMSSSLASKVRERHSVLVLNIGTFAEEDEAYERLNGLSISLPIVAMVTWVLDALLGLSLIHISEPTRRVVISYAVFCFKKKN